MSNIDNSPPLEHLSTLRRDNYETKKDVAAETKMIQNPQQFIQTSKPDTGILSRLKNKITVKNRQLPNKEPKIHVKHQEESIPASFVKNVIQDTKAESQSDHAIYLKEFEALAEKTDELARGIFTDSFNIAYSDEHRDFNLVKIGSIISSGAFGRVYLLHDIITGKNDKVIKQTLYEPGLDVGQIQNEYDILTKIHKNGHVIGIQKAPYKVIQISRIQIGYIAPKYDFDLKNAEFRSWPTEKKIEGFLSLIKGLHFLHENGIIHADIKPANCCSDQEELQLADFGGSIKFTPSTLVPQAYSFNYSLPNFSTNMNRLKEEGKLEDLLKYYKRNDVFALGKVFLECLLNSGELKNSQISESLNHLSNNPKIPSSLVKLITKMITEDPEKEISIRAVETQYKSILNKHYQIE